MSSIRTFLERPLNEGEELPKVVRRDTPPSELHKSFFTAPVPSPSFSVDIVARFAITLNTQIPITVECLNVN
jgi:hypothetical protein